MSKKSEFYEKQEQREADRPRIKDGFSFLDRETYDNLPLTRWRDKSGKPIEDHPGLPTKHRETAILKRKSGMPIEIMLKSKLVRETLKTKGSDPDEVKTGKATVGQDLMRLLERLADDKPVVSTRRNDEPEITIMRREEVSRDVDSMKAVESGNKEMVRTLFEKISEDILRRTTLRRKKVWFKEEVEDLGLGQEYGDPPPQERDGEEEHLSGSQKNETKEIMGRIVCVKLKDDIHNPGDLNGQMMALKEHVETRYQLSDPVQVQRNDKIASNLSKWIRTGVKEKGDLEEDSNKILSQFSRNVRSFLPRNG